MVVALRMMLLVPSAILTPLHSPSSCSSRGGIIIHFVMSKRNDIAQWMMTVDGGMVVAWLAGWLVRAGAAAAEDKECMEFPRDSLVSLKMYFPIYY